MKKSTVRSEWICVTRSPLLCSWNREMADGLGSAAFDWKWFPWDGASRDIEYFSERLSRFLRIYFKIKQTNNPQNKQPNKTPLTFPADGNAT